MIVGAGTELKRILRRFGIIPTQNCKCEERAQIMDLEGPRWCRDNLETIVGWLKEEAKIRGMPFCQPIVRLLIKRAIRAAEHKIKILEH